MWHHCRQVFTSCSASLSRPLPFFPRGCTISMATTIACCPCHLVRVTSTLPVVRLVFRQTRMISFLSGLAVLPTCFLHHDSRPFGLTLRPSVLVCCGHRVSWARGRLAFEQESVRVSFFPRWVLYVMTDYHWFQAVIEKCLLMRCGNVMALIHVNLFLETPKFQVLTSYSTNSSGYTWARSKKKTKTQL